MREGSFLSLGSSGFHRIVYSDYGPVDGPVVVCVHYLTGNAFYFDALARALATEGYRVIAPDMPGRGRSEWLKNPEDYNFIKYAADLTALLAHLNINRERSIDWIGASMGGLLGIALAAAEKTPIKKLALIDIGPALLRDELKILSAALESSHKRKFATLADLEQFIRETRAGPWGPVPENYWRDFTAYGHRTQDDGSFILGSDPAINVVFSRAVKTGVDLWAQWDSVPCPVLALRGGKSTVFPLKIAQEMQKRGPGKDGRFTLLTYDDCGHVPSLTTLAQISAIRDFLRA